MSLIPHTGRSGQAHAKKPRFSQILELAFSKARNSCKNDNTPFLPFYGESTKAQIALESVVHSVRINVTLVESEMSEVAQSSDKPFEGERERDNRWDYHGPGVGAMSLSIRRLLRDLSEAPDMPIGKRYRCQGKLVVELSAETKLAFSKREDGIERSHETVPVSPFGDQWPRPLHRQIAISCSNPYCAPPVEEDERESPPYDDIASSFVSDQSDEYYEGEASRYDSHRPNSSYSQGREGTLAIRPHGRGPSSYDFSRPNPVNLPSDGYHEHQSRRVREREVTLTTRQPPLPRRESDHTDYFVERGPDDYYRTTGDPGSSRDHRRWPPARSQSYDAPHENERVSWGSYHRRTDARDR